MKMVKIKGSESPKLAGIRAIGKAAPNEIVEVTLHLRSRNHAKNAIEREIARLISGQRKPMTREEWEKTFGADPADVAKIEGVAKKHGLAVVSSHLGMQTIKVMGDSEKAAAFFGVERKLYESPDGGLFTGYDGAVRVPAEIAPLIKHLGGLDERQLAHRTPRPQWIILPPAPLSQAGFQPTTVARAYDFPQEVTGKGVTIGVIEMGGGYLLEDFKQYSKWIKTPLPQIVAVSVDGSSNDPMGPSKLFDGEVTGDMETIAGVAPGAKMAVYFTKNTNQGFLDAVNYAVHDKVNQPSILSVSWGDPESNYSESMLQTFNGVLQAAALLGITVCCASGDHGSSAGEPSGEHVSFPASSPYALACGGTTLMLANPNIIKSEVVWNNETGASGGGFSEVFPLPDWQKTTQAAKLAKKYKKTGRGVPDVASVGDPKTGYMILVHGKYVVGAGTSAAAPLWAGLIARVNEKLGRPVGFVNPLLYQSSGVFEKEGAFHAITSGNNGAYQAGPGWNPCTGFGSPDGENFAAAMATEKTGKALAATR
ncbi:MAG TPA: S53 family peptidase [Candidatus Acidoferrum sp.]|nr:S53 family peptidase [Candidatus Acidoferrum sp.]